MPTCPLSARNPISIAGAVLVTTSAPSLFLFVFLLDLFGLAHQPVPRASCSS